jgi:adenylate cyclase
MQNREIERKFLVRGTAWRTSNPKSIRQGYLSTDPDRVVRVRVDGKRGVITIKGRSRGAIRAEYEYEIPSEDAGELLLFCVASLIEKERHLVEHAGFVWEVDEFSGDNRGLVVAELEVKDEADFERALRDPPDWVGRDVTDDARLTNARLAETPWCRWTDEEKAGITVE